MDFSINHMLSLDPITFPILSKFPYPKIRSDSIPCKQPSLFTQCWPLAETSKWPRILTGPRWKHIFQESEMTLFVWVIFGPWCQQGRIFPWTPHEAFVIRRFSLLLAFYAETDIFIKILEFSSYSLVHPSSYIYLRIYTQLYVEGYFLNCCKTHDVFFFCRYWQLYCISKSCVFPCVDLVEHSIIPTCRYPC